MGKVLDQQSLSRSLGLTPAPPVEGRAEGSTFGGTEVAIIWKEPSGWPSWSTAARKHHPPPL